MAKRGGSQPPFLKTPPPLLNTTFVWFDSQSVSSCSGSCNSLLILALVHVRWPQHSSSLFNINSNPPSLRIQNSSPLHIVFFSCQMCSSNGKYLLSTSFQSQAAFYWKKSLNVEWICIGNFSMFRLTRKILETALTRDLGPKYECEDIFPNLPVLFRT